MSESEVIPDFSVRPLAPTREMSSWCHSAGKRAFDICFGLSLLVAASPLFLVISISIKLTSEGPILFRQQRVGRGGKEFQLLKFRSMTDSKCRPGPGLTRAGDSRVTPLGRVLRKWKLDELPQLLNLLRGDMSLVGPRPDLAEFFDDLKPTDRRVLSLIPGITGWATLHFRNEEELLARIPESLLRQYYVTEVLPQKIDLDLEYAAEASFVSDLAILFRTLLVIAG